MTTARALPGIRLPSPGWRTRFAPAPTGYLHLGHLVNAIHVWGLARASGGQVVLRLEDHDRTRCRPEYEAALLQDLEWLGFIPDDAHISEFRAGATRYRQSDNSRAYAAALETLNAQGRTYACVCSRRDVQRRAGPVVPGEEARYDGACRNAKVPSDSTRARRVLLTEETIVFHDLALGEQQQTPSAQCGDVLVRDRFGHWTYQFAVVVDDRDQQIDVVIRGEDLLSSTGRQVMLAKMLGRERSPQYLHHPLIRHADGRKLSKASNDTSLRELRAGGANATALIGEAAFRGGASATPEPVAAHEVAQLFG